MLEARLTGDLAHFSAFPWKRYETQTLQPPARDEFIEKVLILETQVARVLATIRSVRNQTVVVNRLPPELLARILWFRQDDNDLTSATQVCGRWRSTLLSTPLLWTNVVFEDRNRLRPLAYLSRSKNAPLHVSVNTSTLIDTDLYGCGMPWIPRTKSLSIWTDRAGIERIAGQLCLPAPLLQSLTFNAGYIYYGAVDNSIRIPYEFLGRQAQFLQELTFISVSPTPISNLPLQNLTNLRWNDRLSSVAIKDLLTLLASAPLLEAIDMDFPLLPERGPEPPRVITLRKLRKLAWWNRTGPLSLMPFLNAPLCNDATVRVNPDRPHTTLSTILAPYRGQFPLLGEPTALRYTCGTIARACYFTYTNGQLTVCEVLGTDWHAVPPTNHWFSSVAAISFGGTRRLVVEGNDGYPQPGDIPVEQFESLEGLELVGDVSKLLRLVKYQDNEVLPVPFPSLLELRITVYEDDFPFQELAEVLRERKEVGCGVRTVRSTGRCRKCSREEAEELEKFVDVLVLH